MPTFRKKKSGKGSWSAESKKTAIESALAAEIIVRKPASRCNLRKSSLQDRISNITKGREVQIPPKLGTFERKFAIKYDELANHIDRKF
jgi:hypothetical protein